MFRKQIAAYRPTCEQERSDKEIIVHYIEDYAHNILLRDNKVAHMTASGFVMNKDLTKVLVIFHKIYQSWGWTGGHADGDRDLLEIALKEVQEETGLKHVRPLSEQMMSIDILPVWGHKKKEGYVSAHLHLNGAYIIIGDEEEALIVNEEETEGVMWVDADAIEQYSVEPDLNIVYKKLIKAARAYDPNKKEVLVEQPEEDLEDGFAKAIADTSIPIAVHEAKSAYYKAKLVKELTVRSGKGLAGGFKKVFGKK